MPSLTLKNIPDALYRQLKQSAAAHHRSLNSEILYCLERVLCIHPVEPAERIGAARRLRAKTAGHPLTDAALRKARDQGRP